MIYATTQGDMFDLISYNLFGTELYSDLILKANPKYRDVYIFSSGINLEIPNIEEIPADENLPPWKEVLG